jgi:hypothetical protein
MRLKVDLNEAVASVDVNRGFARAYRLQAQNIESMALARDSPL